MPCRRQVAWSTATFADAVLSSFVVPFGPLLLLFCLGRSPWVETDTHADSDSNLSYRLEGELRHHLDETTLQWITVAKLWSQAFAGFVAGRMVGKVLGPRVAASRAGVATFLMACGFAVSVATHMFLGYRLKTIKSDNWMLWARALGGLFTGVLCSGVLSLSAPCPPSSPCEQCDELPRRRNFSEISHHGGGGADKEGEFDMYGGGGGTSRNATAELRRADSWSHAGLVVGPLVGGLSYGRSLGWRWLDGGDSRPGFVAAAAACSCVLLFAAWRSPRFRETVALASRYRRWRLRSCGSPGTRAWKSSPAARDRRSGAGADGGGQGEGKGWIFSRRRTAAGRGYSFPVGVQGEGEAREDDEAAVPLLGGASVRSSPGSVSQPPDRADVGVDMEAGEAGGAGGVSARYLTACGGDATAAKKMWNETIRWRRETGAERSLSSPQPTLEIIRECYPYYAHGRSKKGEVVVYERTGRMQFGRLAEAGVTPSDMQMHYAFFNDFVFGKLLPSDDAQLMTVLDVGELRLSTIRGNTVVTKYLAATAEVMQKHYPERQSRILVVNAPWWFAGIWKTVSGMLASGTQAKLQIRGTNFLPTLLEHVDVSEIPPEYGGTSPTLLGHSSDEKALKALAASLGPTTLSSQPTPPSHHLPLSSNSEGHGSGGGVHEAGEEQSGAVAFTGGRGDRPAAVASGLSGGGDLDLAAGASLGLGGGGVGVDDADTGIGGVPGDPAAGIGGRSRVSSSSNTGGVSHAGRAGNRLLPDSSVVSAAGSGAGSGGSGGQRLTQRLASAVRRIRGSATQAYLGVENKFRYDKDRQVWVFDGDESDGGGDQHESEVAAGGAGVRNREDNGTPDDRGNEGSERALIRAIQAAQQARGGGSGGRTFPPPTKWRSGGSVEVPRATWRMEGPPPGVGSGGFGSTAVVMVALRMACAALGAGLEACLPLWMLSSADQGGLEFSAAHTGIVLSIAAAALAFPRYWAPAALFRMTSCSPVQTLRAATSVQVIATSFMSGLASPTWMSFVQSRGATAIAAAVAIATVRAASMVSRPALANLLKVALGHSPGCESSGSDIGGASDAYYYPKRRRGGGSGTGGTLLQVVAVGVSQMVGVLTAGAAFGAAVKAGTPAGTVLFRLAAVAYVGIYLATLFVHATEGSGGRSAGRRAGGASGAWLTTCDFVEEAIVARGGLSSARGAGGVDAGVGGSGGGGGARIATGSMVKES